ncbi:MAG: GEVED domain-containing protein [Bacteroidales bacterium]
MDNDWADPDDHVFINSISIAGPNVLTFIVPSGAVAGQSYARFRFRDYNAPISFDGYVQNGEVEDYTVFIQEVEQEYDFGDAPEDPCRQLSNYTLLLTAHDIFMIQPFSLVRLLTQNPMDNRNKCRLR